MYASGSFLLRLAHDEGRLRMSIRLIARADDAGSAESADLAIVQAIDEGIVRNVSLGADFAGCGWLRDCAV